MLERRVRIISRGRKLIFPKKKICMTIIICVFIFVSNVDIFAWRSTLTLSDGDSVFFSDKNWGSILETNIKSYQTNKAMTDRRAHFTFFIQPSRNNIFLGDKAQGRFYRHFFRYDNIRISIQAYNPDGTLAGQLYRQGYDNYAPSVNNSLSKGADRITFSSIFNQSGIGRIVISYSYRYNWEHAKGYISPDEALIFNYTIEETVEIFEDDGSDNTPIDIGDENLVVPSPPLEISAKVDHTIVWDANRNAFNAFHFNKKENSIIPYVQYLKLSVPRLRYQNVFWNGEKFILEVSILNGECYSVFVSIDGTDYQTSLIEQGSLWVGELWNEEMIEEFASEDPKEVFFTFKAVGNTNDEEKISIIIDDEYYFWDLHRLE